MYIMGPLVWFSGNYIVEFVVNIKAKFGYFRILTGIAFLLGIGISYTAGHVFTAPSVSIYIAFLLAAIVISDRNVKDIQRKY